MNITIIPQTPEQFDRLMSFLERDHAAYVEAQAERTKLIAEAAKTFVRVYEQAVNATNTA